MVIGHGLRTKEANLNERTVVLLYRMAKETLVSNSFLVCLWTLLSLEILVKGTEPTTTKRSKQIRASEDGADGGMDQGRTTASRLPVAVAF